MFLFSIYSLFSNTILDINGHSASESIDYSKKQIRRYEPTRKGLNLLAPEVQPQEASLAQGMVMECGSIQLKLQSKVTKK